MAPYRRYADRRARGRNLLPEIIIGMMIGLGWEMYSAHEWVYNSSKLVMIDLWIETYLWDVSYVGRVARCSDIIVYEIMAL